MALYVYCPRGSDGALGLVKTLPAQRIRRFDGMNFWDKGKRIEIPAGSGIVCWGISLPEMDGVRVLNSMNRTMDKLDENKTLLKAKVPTVSVHVGRGYSRDQMISAGYVGRSTQHTGGLDILMNEAADYWVQKEQFTAEYRVHSFAGRSIRAGQKVLREGFTVGTEAEWKLNGTVAHPWVRSWDGGWKISYLGFKSTNEMRAIAHAAVKALGLTFGAVDIGRTGSGAFRVLEVNTAPGIEGGTLEAYAKAIRRWNEGQQVEGVA